jgi:hypothetical protein
MLVRLALAGVAALALGVPSASAGGPSILPILLLAKDCLKSDAVQVQCAIQTAKGDRNEAATSQHTVYSGHGKSLQLGITYQWGNDNSARTSQVGEDQYAVTVQLGSNNHSDIGQTGDDQLSVVVQHGDGHFAAISSVGSSDGVDLTAVVQSN